MNLLQKFRCTFPYLMTLIALTGSISVQAAPGVIKDRPLFLGFSVQPNIYFVVDDSGSMAWDVTKTTSARELYPYQYRYYTYEACGECDRIRSDGSCRRWDPNYCSSQISEVTIRIAEFDSDGEYIDPLAKPLYSTISPSPFDNDDFVARNRDKVYSSGVSVETALKLCPGYNATAFDINSEGGYSPWVGYPESTINVSQHYIAVWTDSSTSGAVGAFDPGECSEPVAVSSLSADDQQNYRNWYTYYRKRQNVAKKAVSEVVANSETRMGLATINRGQYFSVKDMTVASNKSNLLAEVFSVKADGSTPLRSALEDAGEYYDGSNSPIQSQDEGGSCQQNYTILMTDGYWNSDSNWYGPGNVDGNSTNEFVRDSDRDSYSNTLADVALKYYATDLDTSLANEVPIIEGVDENPAQHMVTFTVAFGVNGEVVPNSTVPGQKTDSDGMPLYPEQTFNWPKPSSNTNSTIDDVRHAAWNGRGLYLNAKNPQTLIESLEASIDEIESRTGTASALAFNSTSYRTDSKFYYAQFTSGSWGGELVAQELSADLEAGDVQWKASEKLDATTPTNRRILTFDKSANKAVAFRASSLPTSHLNDLNTLYYSDYETFYKNKGKGVSDYLSDAVEYLRGERSLEGASEGAFRNRSTVLGDIINSAPVYVSTALSNWPDYIEPGYISYMRSTFTRTPMLYVGANDGMLHAFSASTGEEQFAYMPKGITSTESDQGLHYLIDRSYNHRYYVDNTVAVSDAYVSGQWKTLLIGGLGAGGKSLFAIDVTDPTSISETTPEKVLWEISIDDLGLTYPKAKVAKMNDGSWVVLVANGYHNTLDGRAKIFMLDIETGALIKTFDTGYGSLSSGQCLDSCNGMSSVAFKDLDGNGTVDFIYAGDLKGNVWAINTYSTKQSEWVFDSQVTYDNGIAKSYSGSSIEPVFITEGRRPITTELVVEDNPKTYNVKTWPNQLLFFGTGQFIAEGDHDTTDAEYVYTVMHANSKYNMSLETTASLFSQRVIKQTNITVDGENMAVRSIEPAISSEAYFEYGYETGVSGAQQKMGWYLPLPTSGERVIHDPLSVSDFVIFNTLVPESDPCTFGASGFTMAISLVYGSNPGPILDFNRDGQIDADDKELSGYQLSSPPAGLTRLGNDGLGQSTFEKPIIETFNPEGEGPNKRSWEELK